MASLTLVAAFDVTNFWDAPTGATIVANANEFRFINAAGYFVQVLGTGFVYDANGRPAPGSGNYTTINVYSDAGFSTLVATASGINAPFAGYFTDGGLVAAAGNDTIFGSSGNDTITGGPGSDTFIGGAGNDVFIGGGPEFDTVDYSTDAANGGTSGIRANLRNGTVQGNIAPDTVIDGFGNIDSIDGVRNLIGTQFADEIWGGGNANRLEGGGGNDFIFGFDGDDTLIGGAGDDTLDGGTGANFYVGNAGNDTFIGGTRGISGTDVDTANYAGASAPIQVLLDTNSSVNATAAGGGIDTLINVERVRGTNFADTFTATTGFTGQFDALNNFEGMGGNDTITGNGTTRVEYTQALAGVTVDLQAGTAFSTDAGDAAGIGVDTFLGGINSVRGSSFADSIRGSDGPQVELFIGGGGNDTIDGGAGDTDVINYRGSNGPVNVDLSQNVALDDGFGGSDVLLNIEELQGSQFGDQLRGDAQDNAISGFNGDDAIFGGGGNDTLIGDQLGTGFNGAIGTFTPEDTGNDTLDGGAGRDVARYRDELTSANIVGDQATGVWIVTTPTEGTDTLIDVEIVGTPTSRYLLVGAGGFADIAAASAAQAVLDATSPIRNTILLAANLGGQIADLSTETQNLNIIVTQGDNNIALGSGDDSVVTGSGNDTITAGDGNDVVVSGGGNDTIVAGTGAGDDVYDAGSGVDTVVYSSALSSVTVDLRAQDRASLPTLGGTTIGALLQAAGFDASQPVGTASGVEIGTDALIGIENIVGGHGADVFIGNASDNAFIGGWGDDTIDGGDGVDTLIVSGNRIEYLVTGTTASFTIQDFVVARDGTDSVSNVELVQFDDGLFSIQDLLTPANSPPAITSNGGGASASVTIAENTTSITALTATDPNAGDTLTFTISGGEDAALFEIRNGNQLHFRAAPDFEALPGAGGTAGYQVEVQVSDGNGGTDTQIISVAVANANEPPTSLAVTPQAIDENTSGAVATFALSDPDTAGSGFASYTYEVLGSSGVADPRFVVTGNSIALAAGVTLDFENPGNLALQLRATNTENPPHVITTSFAVDLRDVDETNPNAPPTVSGPVALTAIDEDTSTTIDAADLLSNANDADEDGLSVLDVAASSGTLTSIGNGRWSFQPAPNDDTGVTFTYRVSDGINPPVAATATLDLLPVNDEQTVPADNSVITLEDTASAVITIGAQDVDGDALTYAIKAGAAPAKGSVAFNAASGTFVYTPNSNANGADTFTILVDDGAGVASEQVVSVTITPVNDAANIGGARTGSVTEDSGTGEVVNGLLTIDDIDGVAEEAFQAGTLAGAYGSLQLTATGAWTYTLSNTLPAVQALNAGQTLLDTIAVRSLDGTASSITVTINGTNDTNVISNGNSGGTLNGTAGNDVINAAGGNDVVNAGAGNDVVDAGTGRDVVNGGAGNDTITGGAGSDAVYGGDGDDTFLAVAGDGSDLYAGGDGADTYDLSALTTAVTVSLGTTLFGFTIDGAGTTSGSGLGTDVLLSIENAIGGSGNDRLTGDNLANVLRGNAGNDTIAGGGGNDTIEGGSGNDSLTGGSGSDHFVFRPGFGNDRVTGFDSNPAGGQDLLELVGFDITADNFESRVTIADVGADTLVTIDGSLDQTIRLVGIGNASTVTVDDFRFA